MNHRLRPVPPVASPVLVSPVRVSPLLVSLTVLLLTAGCGGIVERAGPPPVALTTITADPADAECEVVGTRERRTLGAAPLVVDTLALGMPAAVTCRHDGYFPTTEMLYPLPTPPLAAAVARGEALSPMAGDVAPVGAPKDSAVPGTLTVRLRPMLFTSPGARDRFYANLARVRAARWQSFLDRVGQDCAALAGAAVVVTGPTPAMCHAARERVARQRDEDLRGLELDRRRATFP